jgi:8-oxo-dGTP diphosphatase
VIVDAANVVGSKPDGWWKDRRGAAERLLASLAELATTGVPAEDLELPHHAWWPRYTVVLEGQARGAELPADAPAALRTVAASGEGDDTIVDQVAGLADADPSADIRVVTADRALRARVESLGARTHGPSFLSALRASSTTHNTHVGP